MVLMSSFFVCIKMTLLLFYKRLFLCSSTPLRVFWWVNNGYIVLWFFGSASFYIFQCKPVQWYFLQYFARLKKPVPGGVSGQCNATTTLNVAMPMIFSLVSDIALLVLPLWAISKLRLERRKRLGLMAVFGIGLVACLLGLARILALIIDTDDKADPSWGVAVFLILTAAEETTAVVCACLPITGPLLYRQFRVWRDKNSKIRSSGNDGSLSLQAHSGGKSGSRNWRTRKSFKRVISINHIPTSIGVLTRLDDPTADGDQMHLTSIQTKAPGSAPESIDSGFDVLTHGGREDVETGNVAARDPIDEIKGKQGSTSSSNRIRVQTDTYSSDATWTESDSSKRHSHAERQSVSKESSVEKVDKGPRIRDYGEFARGNTVPDPVSEEDAEGRVWQNYRPDKYFLPNDAIEQDRLDFTHRVFCLQLQLLQDPETRSKSPDDALIL
ncbi:hypothetical protein LQW54_004574 [Pestalotiopsis sp. IQ-011]